MSSGYSTIGSHAGDFLSTNVSEVITIGNTGLATTLRIYDCNAPLNGYLLTNSNGIFTINEANSTIPTCIGIGTTTPLNTATLQVQGSIFTSNIGIYNLDNTLYFNNTHISLSNITINNNINIRGTSNVIGFGSNTLTLGNKTDITSLILSDTVQWKISTYGRGASGPNLAFINDDGNKGTWNSLDVIRMNRTGGFNSKWNLDTGTGAGIVYINTTGTPTKYNISGNILVYKNIAIPNVCYTNTLTVNTDSVINGTLNAQKLICSSNSSVLTLSANTLSVNLANDTFNTFTCSAGANIQTLNITNAICGAQALIFVTATAALTIYGSSLSTNAMSGTPSFIMASAPLTLASGNCAIITITSDGTRPYVSGTLYK